MPRLGFFTMGNGVLCLLFPVRYMGQAVKAELLLLWDALVQALWTIIGHTWFPVLALGWWMTAGCFGLECSFLLLRNQAFFLQIPGAEGSLWSGWFWWELATVSGLTHPVDIMGPLVCTGAPYWTTENVKPQALWGCPSEEGRAESDPRMLFQLLL